MSRKPFEMPVEVLIGLFERRLSRRSRRRGGRGKRKGVGRVEVKRGKSLCEEGYVK